LNRGGSLDARQNDPSGLAGVHDRHRERVAIQHHLPVVFDQFLDDRISETGTVDLRLLLLELPKRHLAHVEQNTKPPHVGFGG
jgi:hypothetical protein